MGKNIVFKKKNVLLAAILCIVTSMSAYGREYTLYIKVAVPPDISNTPFLSQLLSSFENKNRLRIEVVSVDTAKALKLAEEGKVDAVLVNNSAMERSFLDSGFGSDHRSVMHSYFVLVGPKTDPAGIKGQTAKYAFFNIAEKKALFFSRGDGSEIDQLEKRIWKDVFVNSKGDWYIETGKGMEETLAITYENNGYTLSDKLSFASMKDMIDIEIMVEGNDPYLKNVYSIIAVNPKRYTHVKYGAAVMLIDYLSSKEAREFMNGYKINNEQLFYAGE